MLQHVNCISKFRIKISVFQMWTLPSSSLFFFVFIVFLLLFPTCISAVLNLKLHSTRSLIISTHTSVVLTFSITSNRLSSDDHPITRIFHVRFCCSLYHHRWLSFLVTTSHLYTLTIAVVASSVFCSAPLYILFDKFLRRDPRYTSLSYDVLRTNSPTPIYSIARVSNLRSASFSNWPAKFTDVQ